MSISAEAAASSGVETEENQARQFAILARRHTRRLAWIVQEAIATEMEVDRMPRVVKEIRRIMDNLERTTDLLKPHKGARKPTGGPEVTTQ